MNREIARFNRAFTSRDMILKIGIHKGACIAVTLNDRLDYFGQTVNTASRVQGLAAQRRSISRRKCSLSRASRPLLKGCRVFGGKVKLKGIQEEIQVYKIVAPDLGNGRDEPERRGACRRAGAHGVGIGGRCGGRSGVDGRAEVVRTGRAEQRSGVSRRVQVLFVI